MVNVGTLPHLVGPSESFSIWGCGSVADTTQHNSVAPQEGSGLSTYNPKKLIKLGPGLRIQDFWFRPWAKKFLLQILDSLTILAKTLKLKLWVYIHRSQKVKQTSLSSRKMLRNSLYSFSSLPTHQIPHSE